MKTHLLRTTVVVCIGAACALGTMTARADEPKKDDSATAQSSHRTAKTQRHAKTADKKATPDATTVIPTRDGRSAKYVDGGTVGGSNAHERAVLTGSQLPRSYARRGYSTDSRDNTTIYDKNDIRLQSTNTVQDALRSDPSISVGGMR